MAYTKVSNKSQDKDVKYLNKDYNSFKNQLMEFAEVYFPNNFNDFSEGNPGMMFLEMAAYVGDVLSFYTDTQLRENFLLLAQEHENLYNLAYTMGYKPKTTSAASVDLDVYQLVPSTMNGGGMEGYVPDYDYALTINKNSSFKSTEGPKFYTVDSVRFNYSSSMDPTHANVYQYDSSGNPEYFLLRKTTKAISGEIIKENFTIGDATRYKTLNIFNPNIISIESAIDDEGNIWTEVPYLAQDTVFDEIENTGANDPELKHYNAQTPYLLKVKKVPKRFVARFKSKTELEIQFGPGSTDNSDPLITPDPNNIGLGIKDGRSKLDTAYDPSNFMYTKAYGQSPSNTTITFKYLIGGGLSSNVPSNTITEVDYVSTNPNPNLPANMATFIKNSIAVNNPEPARGGGDGDSIEEIRMNTMANFSAQNRTVTKDDYIIRTLSMPPQFGNISKAYITQDDQISSNTNEPNRIPNPLALNLYTLGYDSDKYLTTLNTATKNNLMTYLEQYRMLTDAINIKDGFVINFGLEFEITAFKNYNNQEVLLKCVAELKEYFKIDKWQINQPIIISEAENLLAGIKGVQTVENIRFLNKTGISKGYFQYKYDFIGATKKGVIYPSMDPSIFELKNPDSDIKGRVITY